MKVPQFSLASQTTRIKEELEEVIGQVVTKGSFILGENVQKLEREAARYLDVEYGIGVGSGSDALYLALLACGVGFEDEVITTPFTFFATAGSIIRAGAVPVFVDIDPDTFNLDVNLLEEKITEKTRAIMPVHLYGQAADMAPLMEIAVKHNLKVVEDTAQAMGSLYGGKKSCSFGDAGCLSFFPTKNLGGFGDGGMVVTGNPEVAEKVKMLRVHGSRKKYFHEVVGINSRLDEIQAAVLAVKMKYLDQWIAARNSLAANYMKLFKQHGLDEIVKLPRTIDNAYHTYNQYTIRVPDRDKLQAFLNERGVGTAIYYPLPLHLQPSFSSLNYRIGDFPQAEKACGEVISLPVFPELASEQQEYVVETMKQFYREKGF
ncbi:MAG TPA: transcriptional regulator [Desulfotomaculum sp.]|nr:MAG: Pleiotropic regulatory protein [Desulfotomaculum sp. 46_80]HAG11505.1 transcriptional regulator [Desulfotomaculum sp.]HBY04688.1 transcriptional regulator [Desulfotomaculum sp.]